MVSPTYPSLFKGCEFRDADLPGEEGRQRHHVVQEHGRPSRTSSDDRRRLKVE